MYVHLYVSPFPHIYLEELVDVDRVVVVHVHHAEHDVEVLEVFAVCSMRVDQFASLGRTKAKCTSKHANKCT